MAVLEMPWNLFAMLHYGHQDLWATLKIKMYVRMHNSNFLKQRMMNIKRPLRIQRGLLRKKISATKRVYFPQK